MLACGERTPITRQICADFSPLMLSVALSACFFAQAHNLAIPTVGCLTLFFY
ncbi:hypothetical protein BN1183_AC_01080 [Pantoea ananatis]|nr:hypothetical protein BN1183_AC_01080 [Pantoea ananatis]